MNNKEISAMLEWISRVDRFVQPDPLTVKAWGDVLKADIESVWVKEYLVRYYNNPEATTVTAGIINQAWINRRNGTVHACTVCDGPDGCSTRPPTPMPEWFRDQLAQIVKAKAVASR